MERRGKQNATTQQRGDTVQIMRLTGHRVALSARKSGCVAVKRSGARNGFTLIELVVSISVLTILTLGIIPLVKLSVKRQREQQLRETLREMRTAIDQFHRDTVGLNCSGTQQQQPPLDPRSKVMVSDCTIFGVDNTERYPPDLETLVSGVSVVPRVQNLVGSTTTPATEIGQTATKKKVYLRALPIDPMTGKADWDLRSCYDPPDSDSFGGENVFDVRSKSKDTALNGEKYSDW